MPATPTDTELRDMVRLVRAGFPTNDQPEPLLRALKAYCNADPDYRDMVEDGDFARAYGAIQVAMSTATYERAGGSSIPLGRVVMTASVNAWCDESDNPAEARLALSLLLARHESQDWGNACPEEDKRANDLAVRHGQKIMSVWETAGRRVWITTEWDRSATTIMFPEDY